MSYFSDLIDESHNFGLKNFSCVCEVSYIAEPEDSVDSLSWEHRVEVAARLHVLSDNGRACFSEAEREQMRDLGDSLLQYSGFESLVISFSLLLFVVVQHF